MIFKMTAKAALLAGLVLIGLASAPSFASDGSIEFFPPKNLEAGLGFLYFDAGRIGNQSVYAVPVQSEKLIEAVEKQTLAITELKDSLQKTSGAIQCFKGDGDMYDSIVCVNTVTGTVGPFRISCSFV